MATPEIVSEPGAAKPPQIVVGPETPIACCKCGTMEAPSFRLRRRRGLYEILCWNRGQGCWEQSARRNCEFVGLMQESCTFLSEFEIKVDGAPRKFVSCSGHVGAFCEDANRVEVTPLED